MASKIIFDTPGLLDESLLSLAAACKEFPMKCSRSTLERWVRRGSRGTILETVLIGGKRYTSRESIDRFIHGQLQVEAEHSAPKRSMSKREIATAARRFGLPEPQKCNVETNAEGKQND
jgi:hypothetical protein